ncbi:hypothetical protein BN938_1870 [Mucinivorans hirudinis]|uniref:Uncharacterized protein n=1 Tax=Mucinivorans hirudinis TaxID=1433126 RepID=A0A060R8T7_9BACT|nr:hypothetical protein BN938_1870 [Mucinivorans hirudinis]
MFATMLPTCIQKQTPNTNIEAVIEDYEQISKPFPVRFEK